MTRFHYRLRGWLRSYVPLLDHLTCFTKQGSFGQFVALFWDALFLFPLTGAAVVVLPQSWSVVSQRARVSFDG